MEPITVIEIDLCQLRKNLHTVKNFLPECTGIIGVVKSNAYGHGLLEVAKTLQDESCDLLGVGLACDARRLRASGIISPILVIYPVQPNDIDMLVAHDVDITVTSSKAIEHAQKSARKYSKVAKLHLMIDTGMHHYGCSDDDAVALATMIRASVHSELSGVSTHFSAAENDPDFTNAQHIVFINTLKRLAKTGISPATIHTASSSAIDRFPASFCDPAYRSFFPNSKIFVRPGCLLYGTYTVHNKRLQTKYIMKSMTTHISEIKKIKETETVGYFNQYHATKPMEIAILPLGWAENGYFPSSGLTLVHGEKRSIIGSVSANTTVIDVSGLGASEGDKVTIVGKDGKSTITIEELARYQGTFVNRAIALVCTATPKVYIDAKD